MKRIIDIDDEWFESIIASKDHIDKDDEAYLILNSTPYEERPQGKWIPVSERLPEENGVYLVTLEYVEDSEIVNEIDMAWFMYSEKDDCNNGFHKAYPIVAWQPLPELYKKGGAE